MKKDLPCLALKIVVLALIVLGTLLPLSERIYRYRQQCESHSLILTRNDIGNYSYCLIGDSVFNSRYVDSESETIWSKFETCTGRRCFPGSLYAAGIGDFVHISKYVSRKLKPEATVFVDIMPTKLLGTGNSEEVFADNFRSLELADEYLLCRYVNYLAVDYLRYLTPLIRGEKTDIDKSQYRNRVWNVDGDPYEIRAFKQNFAPRYKEASSFNDFAVLDEVVRIFRSKRLRVVFVLTDVNREMLQAYTSPKDGELILGKITALHEATMMHLRMIDAQYIDLFNLIPSRCFADLVHTNACGDEMIAQALGQFAAGKQGRAFR